MCSLCCGVQCCMVHWKATVNQYGTDIVDSNPEGVKGSQERFHVFYKKKLWKGSRILLELGSLSRGKHNFFFMIQILAPTLFTVNLSLKQQGSWSGSGTTSLNRGQPAIVREGGQGYFRLLQKQCSVTMYRSGSGSFHRHAKIKENLDLNCFVTY